MDFYHEIEFNIYQEAKTLSCNFKFFLFAKQRLKIKKINKWIIVATHDRLPQDILAQFEPCHMTSAALRQFTGWCIRHAGGHSGAGASWRGSSQGTPAAWC